MSSRQDDKEARRAERIAQEQAAAASAARRRRISIVLGALVAVAAVAAVIAVVAGGGGSDKGGDSGGGPSGKANATAPIPKQKLADLAAAAKAAKCTLDNPKDEGNTHVNEGTAVTYKHNPPTSGNHWPNAADDGNYVGQDPPPAERTTHSLEHGRIDLQYRPDLPQKQVNQLQTLFSENDGYHVLLFANQTEMPYDVAATAWDHAIVCKTFNDRVFDALRAFRERYTDQGPEIVP